MDRLNPHRLNQQVKEMLRREIISGIYSKSEMLPSEKELEAFFNVSRGTIRHAVTALEQQGYLGRRQGIGTFIHRDICDIETRIDLKIEFSDLIKQSGFHPRTEIVEIKEIRAQENHVEHLRVKLGDAMLSITKKWFADDNPIIVCTDVFSVDLIQNNYSNEVFENDIFSLIKILCDLEVDYQIARIVPCFLNKNHSEILLTSTDTPVLSMKGIGYDFSGLPILYGEEYYAPGFLDFTLVRARS